jgi:hypothetical protein
LDEYERSAPVRTSIDSFRWITRLPLGWWVTTLAAALFAAGTAHHLIDNARAAEARLGASVEVPVTTHAVDSGSILTAGDIRSEHWPVAFLPHMPPAPAPAGSVVTRALSANQVITTADLAPAGTGPVAALLEPGERAIQVPSEPGREPDVRVGDHVELWRPRGEPATGHVVAVSDRSTTVAVEAPAIPALVAALADEQVTVVVTGSGDP